MKKVFLSLAMIAALTVVSCKQTEEKTEEVTTNETEIVAEPVAVDTAAAPVDSAAAPVEAAPAE